VVLLRIAGYNFNDIAKIMNTSINTALGQLHYAKQNLNKK
jgi:DNA-directed RNA polymerase specialized sigma24 family protein